MIVNKETYTGRLSACRTCEHFVKKTQTCGTLALGTWITHNGQKIRACGCVMPVKAKLRLAHCPIGRWHAMASAEEVEHLRSIYDKYKTKKRLTMPEIKEVVHAYNLATGHKKEITACSPCVVDMIRDIGLALKQGDIEWKI